MRPRKEQTLKTLFFAAIAAFLALAPSAFAQVPPPPTPPTPITVTGTVVDAESGTPFSSQRGGVSMVLAVIRGGRSDLSATNCREIEPQGCPDRSGAFRFTRDFAGNLLVAGAPDSQLVLRVGAFGYLMRRIPLPRAGTDGAINVGTIALTPSPVEARLDLDDEIIPPSGGPFRWSLRLLNLGGDIEVFVFGSVSASTETTERVTFPLGVQRLTLGLGRFVDLPGNLAVPAEVPDGESVCVEFLVSPVNRPTKVLAHHQACAFKGTPVSSGAGGTGRG